MPTHTRETLLARYHYDPLDHQVGCTPFDQAAIQRYYCKSRLSTEIQGSVQRTIVQHDDQLLAQQHREAGKVAATLLATDQQRSVLNALDANQLNPLAYSPYGHRPLGGGLLSLLGFNGERPDPVTGHYHLGIGYRQFNPVLMRFNSPDSWSPFGKGGLNAYAYCEGDPVNSSDPSGHGVNPRFLSPPPVRRPIISPAPGSLIPHTYYDEVIPAYLKPATQKTYELYREAVVDDFYGYVGTKTGLQNREERTAYYAARGMTDEGFLLPLRDTPSQASQAASTVPSPPPQSSGVQRTAPPPTSSQRPQSPRPYSPPQSDAPLQNYNSAGSDSIPTRANAVRGNP